MSNKPIKPALLSEIIAHYEPVGGLDSLLENIIKDITGQGWCDAAETLDALLMAQDKLLRLENEFNALTRDRDEWKQSTIDANKSIDTSHKRYKEMYAEIRELKAENSRFRNALDQIVYNTNIEVSLQEKYIGNPIFMLGTIARNALKQSEDDTDETQ